MTDKNINNIDIDALLAADLPEGMKSNQENINNAGNKENKENISEKKPRGKKKEPKSAAKNKKNAVKKKSTVFYKIGALLAAVIMWLYVVETQSPLIERIYYSIPVEVRNLGDNLVLMEQNYSVQVRVKGAAAALDELETTDINAIMDFSGYGAGAHSVHVDYVLPELIQLVKITPDTLSVYIEETKSREFDLVVETSGIPADGYNALDAVVTPSKVTISGAERYLEQVAKVFISPIIGGMYDNYSRRLPIQIMGVDGNIMNQYFTIDPAVADVVVPIVQDLPERSVAVSVQYNGTPAAGYAVSRIVLEPSTVKIYGEFGAIQDVLSVQTEPIDIMGADKDIIRTVNLVAGKDFIFGAVSTVTVIIQIQRIEEKLFKEIPVTAVNAADNVDEGDEHACIHVALHELARTVHCAVEVRFPAHIFTAAGGFIFIDKSGVEVGLNRHLFAGHGVQGEPRRHFGDTRGTGGDDHLVQNKQNQKDNRANYIVAAHHEFAESLNHLTGSGSALLAIHENQAGGGHIQCQAQHGGNQQQGRENGEFQRRQHKHGCHQNDEGK